MSHAAKEESRKDGWMAARGLHPSGVYLPYMADVIMHAVAHPFFHHLSQLCFSFCLSLSIYLSVSPTSFLPTVFPLILVGHLTLPTDFRTGSRQSR